MSKKIFITGGTGFLGMSLLQRVTPALSDSQFYLLVRSKSKGEKIINSLCRDIIGRIQFVEGDLISGFEMPSKIDEIWHLAASTSFEESKRKEIETINVGGTSLVIKQAEEANVEDIFYTGTAYECGAEDGLVLEKAFTRPAKFKNPYEETKFDAESIVRTSSIRRKTIVRPSIIMGDSRTFDSYGDDRGFYGYFFGLFRAARAHLGGEEKFWKYWVESANCAARLDLNAKLVGHDHTTKNIVTIDYVVDTCAKILTQEYNRGKTYNLVNPINISMRSALDAIEEVLHMKGFSFDPELILSNLQKGNIAEFKAFRATELYWPYTLISEPRWEIDNAMNLGVRPALMNKELFMKLIQFKMREYYSTFLNKGGTVKNGA